MQAHMLLDLPDPLMLTIIGLRVAAVELPHHDRQIGLWRFDQEMRVIVHQTVGMAKPLVPIDHMGQQGQPLRPIADINHDKGILQGWYRPASRASGRLRNRLGSKTGGARWSATTKRLMCEEGWIRRSPMDLTDRFRETAERTGTSAA